VTPTEALAAVMQVLDGHPTPHALVGADGTLRWASRAWRATLSADSWQACFGAPWRLLDEPLQVAGPDGRRFLVTSVQRALEGGLTLVEGRDVTLEVHRLEALAASEHSFRLMAENVPGALFRYGERADGTSYVDYMSPRCVDLWEVAAEVVMRDASPLWGMVHPDDLPGMAASVKASGQTMSPWFHEWRITTPSGKKKWLQGVGRPAPARDGGVLWNTFILDVTDRKQTEARQQALEAELSRTQRLEALGRLAGGVAHDFNNLLTVILTATQSLHDGAPAGSPERELLGEVVQAAERSAELTRQLLSFGRRQPASPRRIDPSAQVRQLQGLMRRLIPESIALEFSLPPTAPVLVDPTRFEQLVANLILNARDAISGHGTIRVAVSTSALDGRAGVRLEVADDGQGMDAATRARLFEPFFTTKAPGAGTGLGLSIVHAVVEESGGRLFVDSAPGQGAVFTVWFPASEGPVPAVAARPRPVALQGPVLVVEDDLQVRRQVVRTLEAERVPVTAVSTREEALEAVATRTYRVALVDVVLAGSSGPALAHALIERGHEGPLVYMTGYIGDDAARALVEAAEGPLLAKPFTGAQLLDALSRAVDRSS
jgi:signal transduction histidine kinase/CheY-like chemotaxis protein